jgi:hypothetical protein
MFASLELNAALEQFTSLVTSYTDESAFSFHDETKDLTEPSELQM